MKKIYIFLSLSILFFSLYSCNNGIKPVKDNHNPIKEYDAEIELSVGDSTEIDFYVKDKKYSYKGNDILILNVENKTEENYTLNIMVTYFDESGKVLKKEGKIFEGFASGWGNHFLFQPNITFDDYEYKFSFDKFEGVTIADKVSMEFTGIREGKGLIENLIYPNVPEDQSDISFYPRLSGLYTISHTYNEQESRYLAFDMYIIFFDENGEICRVANKKGDDVISEKIYEGSSVIYYNEEDPSKLNLPDSLKGEITCIFSIDSVKIADGLRD